LAGAEREWAGSDKAAHFRQLAERLASVESDAHAAALVARRHIEALAEANRQSKPWTEIQQLQGPIAQAENQAKTLLDQALHLRVLAAIAAEDAVRDYRRAAEVALATFSRDQQAAAKAALAEVEAGAVVALAGPALAGPVACYLQAMARAAACTPERLDALARAMAARLAIPETPPPPGWAQVLGGL
jgi:hypothetical protein